MHRGFATALVLGLSARLFTPTARAGVTYSPTIIRRITARATDDLHTLTAPDLGTFDGEVTADGSNADFRTRARASQHSVLGPDGITLSGTQEFEVAVLNPNPSNIVGFSAETTVDDEITFTLDRATPFTFAESRVVKERSGSLDSDGHIILADRNGKILHGFEDEIPASGTLAAGKYSLDYQFLDTNSLPRGNSTPGKIAVDYDLAFLFPAQTGGGNGNEGGGPTPVPLPPAVWTGLATLGLVGFAWSRCRRAVT
jgi:hypothetical protein